MDFKEFKDSFIDQAGKALKEAGYGAVEFTTQATEKVNEAYESLVVKPHNGRIGVNFNIEQAYRDVENGVATVKDVVTKGIDAIKRGLDHTPNEMIIKEIGDYESARNRLTMEVVAKAGNEDMLSKVPHKDMEDMAVIYRLDMSDAVGEGASIVVTNSMLDCYGITAEQLHNDALESAPQIRPAKLQGMGEVLAQQMGVDDLEMLGINIPPEDEKMFVASVEGNVHGASVIAYQDFMDKVAERMGGDFFILPSSLHELIIVPDTGEFNVDNLKDMVKEVNATQVAPEDKLTDSVYHYDSKDKVFELGEKFVQRQAEKDEAAKDTVSKDNAPAKEAAAKKPKEKKSVIGALKAAKEDIAKQPKKVAEKKPQSHNER